MTLIALIFTLIILGFTAFLVSKAPMLNPDWKAFINYLLLAVGGFLVIVFVASLFGVHFGVPVGRIG